MDEIYIDKLKKAVGAFKRVNVINVANHLNEKNIYTVINPRFLIEKDGVFYYKTNLMHLAHYYQILEVLSDGDVAKNVTLINQLNEVVRTKTIYFHINKRLEDYVEVSLVVNKNSTIANYFSHRVLEAQTLPTIRKMWPKFLEYDHTKENLKTFYEILGEIDAKSKICEGMMKFLSILAVGNNNSAIEKLKLEEVIEHLVNQKALVDGEIARLE